ncbi:MAG: hypothetical protein ACI9BC_001394 [Crocinitomicaceae bacterium]|jgi:hypothetical protein
MKKFGTPIKSIDGDKILDMLPYTTCSQFYGGRPEFACANARPGNAATRKYTVASASRLNIRSCIEFVLRR